jgi:hypothetical protein
MNSIEHELRRVMTDHDGQAPAAADLMRALEDAAGAGTLGPARRPVRWRTPLLAAAAVAAVIAGSVWGGTLLARHQRERVPANRAAPPPLSCPARYARLAPWVPEEPAGVDGRSRLVPRRTPASAVICEYGPAMGNQPGRQLAGRRVLAGGLSRLAAQLTWQPRKVRGLQVPCLLVLGTQTDYLIGLTYSGGGTVWVAATINPNGCISSSNGQFTSFSQLGALAMRAFRSGNWPPTPPATCNGPGFGGGRLGQETAMVPPGSISLLICPAGRMIRSGYGRLVAALNSLPNSVSTRQCSERGSSRRQYWLLFSYREGPPVLVDVTAGCYPQIDNMSLQAYSAHTVLPIIERLIRSR